MIVVVVVVVVVVEVMVLVEVVIAAMHGVPLVSGTKRRTGVTWLARQRWN